MIMPLLYIVVQLCMLVLSPVTAQLTASCQGSGDVHYKTFDGYSAIDVQGTCMHTVARTCCANSCPFGATPQPGSHCTRHQVLDEFHVMAQHKLASAASTVSYVDYVVVELCGYTVVMKTVGNAAKYSIVCPRVTTNAGIFNRKYLNQNPDPATPAFQCRSGMASPAFRIDTCGAKCIELTTTYGVVVRYDTYFVKVTVPSRYQNVMCGICGDYNGDFTNDFRTKDGENVVAQCDLGLSQGSIGDYKIGNSWIVNNCHTANCVQRNVRRKRSISTRAITPSEIKCNGWIDDICPICPSNHRAPILRRCLTFMLFVEAQCEQCKTRSCSCEAIEAQLRVSIQGKVKTDCGACDCGNCRALVSRGCLSGDAKKRALTECLVDCKILQGEAARVLAKCRGRRARTKTKTKPGRPTCPPLNWMEDNAEAVMSVVRANSGKECRIG